MHVEFTGKNRRRRKAIGWAGTVRTRDGHLYNDFTKSSAARNIGHQNIGPFPFSQWLMNEPPRWNFVFCDNTKLALHTNLPGYLFA